MKKGKKTFEMNDDYHLPYGAQAATPGEADAALLQWQSDAPPALESQMDEVVQGLSGAKVGGQVYLIDVRQLEPYPDQPFKQYSMERMQELAEDIARVGVLSPILCRQQGRRLQILAGHNRWAAAKLAGLAEVPVMVLEVDDDAAVLVLTSTNLRQREHLAPSEKAFAYKMQMEALKRQGQRGQEPYNASAMITRQTGDSRMQIHRYVRLTELEPGLLELLDRGKISMTPAVAVSHLQRENQQQLLRLVGEFGASLTIERANILKGLAAESQAPLSRETVEDVMLEAARKKPAQVLQIPLERIRTYLPPGAGPEQAEAYILQALRAYAPAQQQTGKKRKA